MVEKNLGLANFHLSDTVEKRTLATYFKDQGLNVHTFGATGNGIDDDTDAIQATLDAAYGSKEAPHGAPWLHSPGSYTEQFEFHLPAPGKMFLNRPVVFPPGQYKVSSMLRIDVGYGVNLIGAGSHQTRIFWNGPSEPYPAEEEGTKAFLLTALMTFYMCWGSRISGITFDAGDTQQSALRLGHWPPHLVAWQGGDDGSHGFYEDVCFANATSSGFVSIGDEMGSERYFFDCRFMNNALFGHRMVGQNALNHSFFGCHAEGNGIGISSVAAGHSSILGSTFANNSVCDAAVCYGPTRFMGNVSTSKNMFVGDGHVIACKHLTEDTTGLFASGSISSPGFPGGESHAGNTFFLHLNSNQAPHSKLGSTVQWYLRGNTFGNPAYKTSAVTIASVFVEDGVQIKP